MLPFTISPFDAPPRFASPAVTGAAASFGLIMLAIALGALGLDREGPIGSVLFPALGIGALLAGVAAMLSGAFAILRERDRSVGTILATIGGALLAWFMVFEQFIGE